MALYQPGKEPEKLRKKLDAFFSKIDAAYPDKTVIGLAQNHKKLGEKCTELYRELGYPDNQSFLEAYGYTYARAKTGRPSTVSLEDVIAELKNRNPGGPAYNSMTELIEANPDLAGKIKTLSNSAQSTLGMTMAEYMYQAGMLKKNVGKGTRFSADEYLLQSEAFLGKIRERYPEGSWFYSVNALMRANEDLREEQGRLISFWQKNYGASLTEILEKENILCNKDKAPKMWEKAIEFLKQHGAKNASGITELLEGVSEIDETTVEKLSKDTLGRHADSVLLELGLLKEKERTKRVTAEDIKNEAIYKRIRQAVENAIEKRIVYRSLDEFARLSLQEQYKSYEAFNRAFAECYNEDASSYLQKCGVLLNSVFIIGDLRKEYDRDRACFDLMYHLYAERSKVSEIDNKEQFSLDYPSGIIRMADAIGCISINMPKAKLSCVPVGTKVNVVRDPYNPFSMTNFKVQIDGGRCIGVLYSKTEHVLAPIVDLELAEIRNGEIIAMDLSNGYSPVVVIAFDLIPKAGISWSNLYDSFNLQEYKAYEYKKAHSELYRAFEEFNEASHVYEYTKVNLKEHSLPKRFRTVIKPGYFSSTFVNSIFRGFGRQIEAVNIFLVEKTGEPAEIMPTNTPDIYEIRLCNNYENDIVDLVMENFPELKMVAFFELEEGFCLSGYVCYSAPGYGYVTDAKFLSGIEHSQDSVYTFSNWPDEESFSEEVWYHVTDYTEHIHYRFPYKNEWYGFNYLAKKEDGFYSVTSIRLPETVQTLGDYSYAYSENLKKIVLPSAIRKISARAFIGSTNLKKPEFSGPNNYLSWNGNALVDNESGELSLVFGKRIIPEDESVKGIGCYVFAGVNSDSITIPANIRFIKDYAFAGCKKLKNVVFQGDIPQMSEKAFDGCKNIISIMCPKASIQDVEWPGLEDALVNGFVDLVYSGEIIDNHVIEGGNNYIERHNSVFLSVFCDNEKILSYASKIKAISPKTADYLLEKAISGKKTELTAILLECKNNLSRENELNYLTLDQPASKERTNVFPLAGLKFAVTGDLKYFDNRDSLKETIENNGGKLIGSVSASTDYLITNNPNSGTTKNRTAKQLGVSIISEEKLFDMITS